MKVKMSAMAGGDCQRCGTSNCVDFESDVDHCGACGNLMCFAQRRSGCTGARCEFVGCLDGFEDADGDQSNGCEASTGTDGTTPGGGDGDNGGSGKGAVIPTADAQAPAGLACRY